MEFIEKAKVRLEHWIHHNEHHEEDYINFADQLDEADKKESAAFIREMADLTSKSSECLKKALQKLEE